MRRTLWRIIATDTPDLQDFMSNDAKGIPPAAPDPETIRLNGGISTWSTQTQARNKATQYPSLGTHLVAVAVDDQDPAFTIERTLSSRGHHTVWGPASVLVMAVDQGSVVPV